MAPSTSGRSRGSTAPSTSTPSRPSTRRSVVESIAPVDPSQEPDWYIKKLGYALLKAVYLCEDSNGIKEAIKFHDIGPASCLQGEDLTLTDIMDRVSSGSYETSDEIFDDVVECLGQVKGEGDEIFDYVVPFWNTLELYSLTSFPSQPSPTPPINLLTSSPQRPLPGDNIEALHHVVGFFSQTIVRNGNKYMGAKLSVLWKALLKEMDEGKIETMDLGGVGLQSWKRYLRLEGASGKDWPFKDVVKEAVVDLVAKVAEGKRREPELGIPSQSKVGSDSSAVSLKASSASQGQKEVVVGSLSDTQRVSLSSSSSQAPNPSSDPPSSPSRHPRIHTIVSSSSNTPGSLLSGSNRSSAPPDQPTLASSSSSSNRFPTSQQPSQPSRTRLSSLDNRSATPFGDHDYPSWTTNSPLRSQPSPSPSAARDVLPNDEAELDRDVEMVVESNGVELGATASREDSGEQPKKKKQKKRSKKPASSEVESIKENVVGESLISSNSPLVALEEDRPASDALSSVPQATSSENPRKRKQDLVTSTGGPSSSAAANKKQKKKTSNVQPTSTVSQPQVPTQPSDQQQPPKPKKPRQKKNVLVVAQPNSSQNLASTSSSSASSGSNNLAPVAQPVAGVSSLAVRVPATSTTVVVNVVPLDPSSVASSIASKPSSDPKRTLKGYPKGKTAVVSKSTSANSVAASKKVVPSVARPAVDIASRPIAPLPRPSLPVASGSGSGSAPVSDPVAPVISSPSSTHGFSTGSSKEELLAHIKLLEARVEKKAKSITKRDARLDTLGDALKKAEALLNKQRSLLGQRFRDLGKLETELLKKESALKVKVKAGKAWVVREPRQKQRIAELEELVAHLKEDIKIRMVADNRMNNFIEELINFDPVSKTVHERSRA